MLPAETEADKPTADRPTADRPTADRPAAEDMPDRRPPDTGTRTVDRHTDTGRDTAPDTAVDRRTGCSSRSRTGTRSESRPTARCRGAGAAGTYSTAGRTSPAPPRRRAEPRPREALRDPPPRRRAALHSTRVIGPPRRQRAPAFHIRRESPNAIRLRVKRRRTATVHRETSAHQPRAVRRPNAAPQRGERRSDDPQPIRDRVHQRHAVRHAPARRQSRASPRQPRPGSLK